MKKPNRDFPASDIYLPRTGAHGFAVRPHAYQAETIPKAGMSFEERHTARKSGGPDGSIPSSAVASVVAESAPVVPLRFRTGHVDRDDLAFEFGLVQSVDSRPALSFVGISTKPNPRERPVSRSVMTLADDTSPYPANKFRKLSSFVAKFRLEM